MKENVSGCFFLNTVYVYEYNTKYERRHFINRHYNFTNFGYRTKLSHLTFLANVLSTTSLDMTVLAVVLQQEKRGGIATSALEKTRSELRLGRRYTSNVPRMVISC